MVFVAYIVFAFTIFQLLVALANLLLESGLPECEINSNEKVSVLIPARNQEDNISTLLDDLLKQDYPNIEIIVFNDQSEDNTAGIVAEYITRDKRVQLINSCGLPKGWQRRNFACHSLSGFARGRYFLFVTPDLRIGNDIISRAVSYSRKYNLDLLSVIPKQIMKKFGEKITVPNINYIIVSLLPLVLVRKLKVPLLAAADGQFMLFTAKKYKWATPHEKLKNSKVEDVLIPHIYKKFGLHTACLLGDDSMTCRRYKGFRDTIPGISRNIIAFFGNSYILAWLFWIITTLGFLPAFSQLPALLAAFYFILYLTTRIVVSIAGRQSIRDNLLYIFPMQFSLFIFISREFINEIYRKFEWKGRNLD
jgi:glycosyltransferase involved in cell wall biosynthesis